MSTRKLATTNGYNCSYHRIPAHRRHRARLTAVPSTRRWCASTIRICIATLRWRYGSPTSSRWCGTIPRWFSWSLRGGRFPSRSFYRGDFGDCYLLLEHVVCHLLLVEAIVEFIVEDIITFRMTDLYSGSFRNRWERPILTFLHWLLYLNIKKRTLIFFLIKNQLSILIFPNDSRLTRL